MFKRALATLAVLLCVAMPSPAYADDGGLVDSFTSGLSSWTTQEERQDEPVAVMDETPMLLEAPVAEGGESSAASSVTDWIGSSIKVNWGTGNFGYSDWPTVISAFLFNVALPVSVLLVFFWWGVRKGIRVLFSAFRKGRMSV